MFELHPSRPLNIFPLLTTKEKYPSFHQVKTGCSVGSAQSGAKRTIVALCGHGMVYVDIAWFTWTLVVLCGQ
jgi:hypothetical protein